MNAIDFQNVSFSYDGQINALDDVSISIVEGSFTCILGGNGSGKSTLAKLINALLVPDKGKVLVLGLPTDESANLFAIRSGAGLVFQNPDDQIVASVVEDDIAFGPENLSIPTEQLQQRVKNALEKVGMMGFEKRETVALSGGQKQRVAIAGILAMNPKIIVLDEASAMLDPRGKKGLIKLCHELNDMGFTIVLITHFMEEAAEADRVIVLDSGCVRMDGSPEKVLTSARELHDLSLDVPFSVQMGLALQNAGVPVKTTIDESDLELQIRKLLNPINDAEIEAQAAEQPGAGPWVSAETQRANKARAAEQPEAGSWVKPLISFEDVSFTYMPKRVKRKEHPQQDGATKPIWGDEGDNLWALRDVSFSLYEGDFLGIAGHTGSGKSTLIQLMANLLHPTTGTILRHDGSPHDIRQSSNKEKSTCTQSGHFSAEHLVGMVFQYPEHQLFAATVYDDVAFGPRNLGLPPEEVNQCVRDALSLVHLNFDDVQQKSPFELSGGQQRRVALAGVLAMEPSVLVLDEPTVGLDPQGRQNLLELISELHNARNMTIAIVSHNMDDLAKLCNRILLLNKGRIVADGNPMLIFSDEAAISRIGLGVPHTVHLANALGLMERFDSIPSVSELALEVSSMYEPSVHEQAAKEKAYKKPANETCSSSCQTNIFEATVSKDVSTPTSGNTCRRISAGGANDRPTGSPQ